MKYRGREIDPVALWAEYVDFPPNVREDDYYLSLVQCPNPEHDTLKRHFQINTVDGLVHCFAHCGISGSYEHAIAMIEGVTEREARKIILRHQRARISKPSSVQRKQRRSRSVEIIRPDSLAYETFLPQIALEYLKGRGITGASIAAWNLGWDQDNRRVVIPARDEQNTLRFLIKRATRGKDWPKYLYQPEGVSKTDVLFGACQIDLELVRSDGLIVVEGSLDVIRLHQLGLRNTVGILGTGISETQARIVERLRPNQLYFMFDKDTSGLRNIEVAAGRLRKYPIFICRYPKGKSDPAELDRKEANRSVQKAVPLVKFKRQLKDRGISLNVNQRERTHSFG